MSGGLSGHAQPAGLLSQPLGGSREAHLPRAWAHQIPGAQRPAHGNETVSSEGKSLTV